MATEEALRCFSAAAAADYTAATNQYKFVKLTANRTVTVCSAITDVVVGVLQNRPDINQAATVGYHGVSKVQADAALTAGQQVGTSADGQADAKTPGTDTTEYVAGVVVTGAAAAGEIAEVMLNIPAHRAA